MPGTPDPVLGSDPLTLVVAAVVATLVVAVATFWGDTLDPLPWTLVFGTAYVLLCLGTWAGVLIATSTFSSYFGNGHESLALVVLLGGTVLGLQVAIPVYLYARWELLLPLVGLFVATTAVLFMVLRVRGETDSLAIYSVVVGVPLVGTICLAAGFEFVARRLLS